jgi:exosortase F-associated protein
MKKRSTILVLFLGILGLVLIRYFEENLFYDPLSLFFKNGHLDQELPSFKFWKLMGFITFRFGLNCFFSLGIIWVLFKDKSILKFSLVLYLLFFLIFGVLFVFLLYNSNTGNYLPLFYIRRFLIQPILLLLLVPAFYFYKHTEK